MNREVISQLCDIAAFILVTPEILGEDTLKSLRERIRKNNKMTVTWVIALTPLFLLVGCLETPLHAIVHGYYIVPAIGIASSVVLGWCADSHIIPAIIWATETFARRSVLFIGGALFFLVARGISIWVALRPVIERHHP